MDALVLEDHVLLKAEQPPYIRLDAEQYKASYSLD
jgi:hypothetical protein